MKIRDFLIKSKEIMGGESFDELRKREKKEIFHLFLQTDIKKDWDGDKDGITYSATVIDNADAYMRIYFYSRSYDIDFVSDYLDSLTIIINHDYEEVSIDKAVEYLDEYGKKPPVLVFNTSILTQSGLYRLIDISLDEAKNLVATNELDSAVGHAATAEIMTTLLDTEIPVNRQFAQQKVGQLALVFKLNGRPEEGKILSREEVEAIGFKFQLLERID